MMGAAMPLRRPQRFDGRELVRCPQIGRLSKNGGHIAMTIPPQYFVDGCTVIFGCATEQSGGDARVNGIR